MSTVKATQFKSKNGSDKSQLDALRTLGLRRIGQTVEHARFGVGVIVATEGRGADARVQVNFGGDAGMKCGELPQPPCRQDQ